jgi:sugar/nucleoside kinase (ribokinase family)
MTQSSQYHVYGLGNALVDMEFQVSPELLQELQIEKGVMTLIQEDQHHHLVQYFKGSHAQQSSGGSAANTVIAVSQLGGRAFYSCRVANDEAGSFFLNDMIQCGVDINQQHQEGHTGKCLVFVTPDADRTMNTFLGISAHLSVEDLNPEAIQHSDYLYLEGYLSSSPTGLEAALKAREIAKQAGCKLALSLSDLTMVNFFKSGIQSMIGEGLDLLFANETEALALAETTDLSEAITYLKRISRCFALTLGAKGSLVFDGETLLEIDPIPVKAVDTVGAGDMYAGALLYGITHNMSYEKAGRLASRASARLVTELGARMPTETLQSLLRELDH